MTLYLLKRHLSPGLPTITDSNFSARATTYLKVGSKQPQCEFPGIPVFFYGNSREFLGIPVFSQEARKSYTHITSAMI